MIRIIASAFSIFNYPAFALRSYGRQAIFHPSLTQFPIPQPCIPQPSTSHRHAKIAALIRSEAAVIALTVPPETANVVSIIDVELSGDGQNATVYLSAFDHPKEACKYMQKNVGQVKSLLSQHIATGARIPNIRFKVDDRSEKMNRLEELLRG